MSSRRNLVGWLLVAGMWVTSAAQAEAPEYVREILRNAKAKSVSVPGQVTALIELAWPHEENPDPQVQAEARRSLVVYGHHVLPVLRRVIPDLPPLYQADAVAAFIDARIRNPSGMPQDFLPGLEEAIWYGSPEAQRVALNEIQRYSYPPAVLSSIDAVYDHPILTRYVAISLGRMNDPRARPFLTELLLEGADFYKASAVLALQRFGQGSVDDFRSGVVSDDPTTRQAAMRVFLTLSETSDLKLMQEYLAKRIEDDPELREAVRKRVDVLERRLAP